MGQLIKAQKATAGLAKGTAGAGSNQHQRRVHDEPTAPTLAEAAEYIAPHLKAGLDPFEIAAHILHRSQGPDPIGRWYLEIPSRWTRTRPTISAPTPRSSCV